MNRKKPFSIFMLSIFAVLLIGCSKDDDEVIVEEKPYKLAEIKWTLKEGDGQEIIAEEIPEQLYRNGGDTIMPVTPEPIKELQGTSHFYIDDSEILDDLENQIKVSVPSQIELLSGNYKYVVGGLQVPFQLDKSYFPLSAVMPFTMTSTYDLNPHTELSYKATLYLKKITATFKARFVQEETSKSYEIEGKWTGVYFQSMKEYAVLDEIE